MEKKPELEPTGLVCPHCKGPYGDVKKIQMKPRVVTFCCRSCEHEWTSDGASGRA